LLSDVSQLKNMNFFVKEGVKYKLKITFNVQRQIVSGLRLVNKVSRGPASCKYMIYWNIIFNMYARGHPWPDG
jgi:hypothetical protein